MLQTDTALPLPTLPLPVTVYEDLKPKKSANYNFINFIRFISMLGIVWAHVNVLPPSVELNSFLHKTDHPLIIVAFYQVFKFSVISFFLISGFLLGDKLTTVNPSVYFKNRLVSVGRPYFVVFSILLVINAIRFYIFQRPIENVNSFTDIIYENFFSTWLWYLPNYLFCLGTLLFFHKVIYKKRLGLFLFAITLTTSILAVYTHKYEIPHTKALFAFIFYLWLGAYFRRNNFLEKIKKTSTTLLFCLVLVTLCLSCVESSYLYKEDLNIFNILRISNQLYSISMFFFLVKICPEKPKFGIFNPREETYGIYLYHGLLIYFLPKVVTFFNSYLNVQLFSYNSYVYMLVDVVMYITIYMLTTLIVKFLLRFNWGYLRLQRVKN